MNADKPQMAESAIKIGGDDRKNCSRASAPARQRDST